ncbi:hypothetical protein A2U01_0072483, partial [Trifolium medium]|nr:hypothetical protein [Trifolium medium]
MPYLTNGFVDTWTTDRLSRLVSLTLAWRDVSPQVAA